MGISNTRSYPLDICPVALPLPLSRTSTSFWRGESYSFHSCSTIHRVSLNYFPTLVWNSYFIYSISFFKRKPMLTVIKTIDPWLPYPLTSHSSRFQTRIPSDLLKSMCMCVQSPILPSLSSSLVRYPLLLHIHTFINLSPFLVFYPFHLLILFLFSALAMYYTQLRPCIRRYNHQNNKRCIFIVTH